MECHLALGCFVLLRPEIPVPSSPEFVNPQHVHHGGNYSAWFDCVYYSVTMLAATYIMWKYVIIGIFVFTIGFH